MTEISVNNTQFLLNHKLPHFDFDPFWGVNESLHPISKEDDFYSKCIQFEQGFIICKFYKNVIRPFCGKYFELTPVPESKVNV